MHTFRISDSRIRVHTALLLLAATFLLVLALGACSATPEAVQARDEAEQLYQDIHEDGVVTPAEAEAYIAALQHVYDIEKQDKQNIDWASIITSLLIGIPSSLVGVRAMRGPAKKIVRTTA